MGLRRQGLRGFRTAAPQRQWQRQGLCVRLLGFKRGADSDSGSGSGSGSGSDSGTACCSPLCVRLLRRQVSRGDRGGTDSGSGSDSGKIIVRACCTLLPVFPSPSFTTPSPLFRLRPIVVPHSPPALGFHCLSCAPVSQPSFCARPLHNFALHSFLPSHCGGSQICTHG